MYFKQSRNKIRRCVPCFVIPYWHCVKAVFQLLRWSDKRWPSGEESVHQCPEHLDWHHYSEEFLHILHAGVLPPVSIITRNVP